MMKCILCGATVPAGALECQQCGEGLAQWVELNNVAGQFLSEGIALAREGESLRAALCLAKAAFLNPDDPPTLKALGLHLARQGIYDQAAYYLKRSADKARAGMMPPDDQTIAALAKTESLLKESTSAPPGDTMVSSGAVAAPPADVGLTADRVESPSDAAGQEAPAPPVGPGVADAPSVPAPQTAGPANPTDRPSDVPATRERSQE